MVNHVFVYGTLRHGCGANRLLGSSERLRTCTLEGATIYHLGGFPGLKFEEGYSVVGELYRVDDARILYHLDGYEGYYPDDPQHSLYIRREITVDGERAYTYEYNLEVREPETTRITTGDWRQQAA